jgi:ComF family protein
MSLLDFIFPKRCVVCGSFGSYLCEADRKRIKPAKSFCPVCLKAAIGGTTHAKCKGALSLDGLICIFDYLTPIKEVVQELKYRFVTDLAAVVKKEVKNSKFLDKHDFSGFAIVPVPLSVGRKNWRGFNQTEVLGKIIAKKLGVNFDPKILIKVKETRPQAKLTRKERVRQVRGSFGLDSNRSVQGQKFIVFDDVWTTGATLKAAAASLKRKGAAQVWGMTLASSH